MTGSRELLEALPRHETAHAALLADILDVLHGSSPAATDQPLTPQTEELSPGELRVLRYLPTNLSRPEIAGELSVSVNTISTQPGSPGTLPCRGPLRTAHARYPRTRPRQAAGAAQVVCCMTVLPASRGGLLIRWQVACTRCVRLFRAASGVSWWTR